jgi:hypothetical protein
MTILTILVAVLVVAYVSITLAVFVVGYLVDQESDNYRDHQSRGALWCLGKAFRWPAAVWRGWCEQLEDWNMGP